jgi:uncharacterized membrane protein YphA (DoxX/SURF4 family)
MFDLKSFRVAWDRFFFSETDASGLSLFRIFLGAFLLLNGLSLIEDFSYWFGIGDDALVPLKDSLTFYSNMRLNLFKWFPPTEISAWFILCGYILASITFTIGFYTRLSAFIAFILMVSLQNRNYAILNSGDTLMRCMLFLMMFAPGNAKYSLDAWIERKRGHAYKSQICILSIRLLQLQFSLVYLATTLFKLKGLDWVDGTAVYYTSRLENFQRLAVPLIFDFPFLVKISTWSALLIEFSMGVLVWVRELRIWVLIAGLILHLMIEVSMSIGFFELMMMASYILFLEPGEIGWFRLKFKKIIPYPII